MRRAITEIEGLITSQYSSTTFTVTRSIDPPGIRVLATVDVDDIAEVLDRYIHRLAQLQVEEELPLSVPSQCRHRRDSAGSSPSTPHCRSANA